MITTAFRSLRRAPGFTITAVLTIAFGICAVTTVWSVVGTILVWPLPYPDADRLVRIIERIPAEESPSGAPFTTTTMNDEMFFGWRERARTLQDMAAYVTTPASVPVSGQLVRLDVTRVSPSLFTMLGAREQRGRLADLTGTSHVVVISGRAWRRFFGASPEIIGRSILIDGTPHQVVAVMRDDFGFPSAQTDLWAPYSRPAAGTNRFDTLSVLARLADQRSTEAATSEANLIGRTLEDLPPQPDATTAAASRRFEVVTLKDEIVSPVKPALEVLAATVGLVFAVLCANLASLMAARGALRRSEFAIRHALGASRLQLAQHAGAEGVLISVAGGAMGTALAALALQAVKTMTTVSLPTLYGGASAMLPGINRASIDVGALAFATVVSVATGLVFTVVPALHAMRDWTWRGTQHFAVRRPFTAKRFLLATQLAVATALMIAAGLLVHSFVRLSRVDLGFSPERSVTFELFLPPDVTGLRRLEIAAAIESRLAQQPSVQAVGFTGTAPLSSSSMRGGFGVTPPGMTAAQVLQLRPGQVQQASLVSPDYLRAIGARLVAGRWLDAGERKGTRAILVNDTLARQFFGTRNAIGESIRIGEMPWHIVGVVGDIRSRTLDGQPEPQAYLDPARMNDAAREAGWTKHGWADGDATPQFLSFAVRSSDTPGRLAADVARTIRSVSDVATTDGIIAMSDVVEAAKATPRFYMTVLSLFAALAVGIAALGIYASLTRSVVARSREFGIRMTLGATRASVLRLVLQDMGVLVFAGLTVGSIAATGLGGYLRTMLFTVSPFDVPTFAAVIALLCLTAALACLLPARRATSITPMEAIRSDA